VVTGGGEPWCRWLLVVENLGAGGGDPWCMWLLVVENLGVGSYWWWRTLV